MLKYYTPQFKKQLEEKLEKKRLSKEKQEILKTLFDEVKKDLKSNDFYQYYFDRNREESFCDKDGTFTCQGPYRGLEDKKTNTCPDGHKINEGRRGRDADQWRESGIPPVSYSKSKYPEIMLL